MHGNLQEKDRVDGIQSTFKYMGFPNSFDHGHPFLKEPQEVSVPGNTLWKMLLVNYCQELTHVLSRYVAGSEWQFLAAVWRAD